ncbi:cupin-like domain-containing protein [Myxococcus stipitatus]|uniref:cupin-like domain-containing protein n=1 Tax=Myxococcus stipitatus TaxID=83455 RepID=UPI0030D1A150
MARASTAPPVEPSLALPRAHWKHFAREHWDQGPTVFRGLFPRHFPSPSEIFEALVDVGERYRRGEVMLPVRFYVEHEATADTPPEVFGVVALSRYLPTAEDGSVDGYARRMERQLQGRRFGLVLSNTQSHHWSHWLQMRSFLSGFHDALGVPLGGADSALFLGNYRHTPFGIHKDDLHVFYFVIQGQRRMSFWPLDALTSRPEVAPHADAGLKDRPHGVVLRDAEDARRLMAQASVLEAEAGDFMYWPASYWHRSEPSEGLTIAASLGVNYRAPMFLERAPMQPWPERLHARELPRRGGWALPAPVHAALGRQGRGKGLRSARNTLTEGWVRLLTNGALDGPPPEARGLTPLRAEDWVRASPSRPIVTVPLSDGQVVVAANGNSRTMRASPSVRRRIQALMEALNSGRPQHIAMLEEDFFRRLPPRAFPRAGVRTLLDELAKWRAVWRHPVEHRR